VASLNKPVEFLGSSLEDLRTFLRVVRREAGFQIDRVQHGHEPFDWKPMAAVGPGAREIRLRDQSGVYRVVYVVKFDDAVYVLHCFQKKTQKTSSKDIEIARSRYRELAGRIRGSRK
jgi:phage-related protein